MRTTFFISVATKFTNLRLLFYISLAFIAAITFVGAAHGGPFFKPDLPDFYQHQKAGPLVNVPNEALNFTNPVPQPATVPSYDVGPTWWENGGGWCCVTAFVNSFYYLEKHFGYDGFFTRTGEPAGTTWQQEMIFAIEDFAKEFIINGTRDIPEYVRKLETESRTKIKDKGEAARPGLTYSEFTLDSGKIMDQMDDGKGNLLPAFDVTATFGSLFGVYHDELCRSEDVTLRLTDPLGVTGAWWSGSFHVVTGAGVEDCSDKTKMKIWFADPDKRNEIKDGAYTDTKIREPYPVGAGVPLPIGQTNYELVTVDADGNITDGLYKGAKIVKITAISPIPEPSTWLLLSSGLVGLVLWNRKRTASRVVFFSQEPPLK